MTDVAIVGGSEETRLLLRGLVRLHHHRVVSEGAGPTSLREIPVEPSDLIVLVDADVESVEWSTALADSVRAHPARRAILIAPTRSPRVEQRAKELGFAAVLRRPFAVHELVEVLAGPPPALPPPVPGPAEPTS